MKAARVRSIWLWLVTVDEGIRRDTRRVALTAVDMRLGHNVPLGAAYPALHYPGVLFGGKVTTGIHAPERIRSLPSW